jgi:outer membrane protein OmpA-like peptidoglycan-associated protein
MKTILKISVMVLIFSLPRYADGQIKVNLKKKIENQTNNRANQKADQAVDKGLDKIEGIFKKKEGTNQENKEAQGEQQGQQASDEKPSGMGQPGLQSYSVYDFVPGDKVLLYEDFSQDAVGDFPALWTTNQSGEINTLSVAPGNWLNLNSTEGNWWFLKPIEFPKNFIVEFDVVPKKGAPRYAVGVAIYGENSFKEMSNPYDCNTGLIVNIAKSDWESHGIKAGSPRVTGNSSLNPVEEEKVNHVIIWVQNRRVRIYHKGSKVLDMPTNLHEGSKFTRFGFLLYRGASSASYVSNIKITTASPDTRNKLLTEGKLVTYGIYFDVNKDVVKPESYGTLNDIAKILNEVPDVKVKIVGHTDADGQDAANLDLSQRRAASVKNELVKTFNVKGDRLITDGMGEGQPVAPNDTPSNKALNRRVEFIKL